MSIRVRYAFCVFVLATGCAQAMSVDELVARNAQARGGLDRIEAIKTLKLDGSLRFTGGFGSIELGFVQYKQAPDSMRTEATVQGLTQVQAEIWRDIGNADHESALRRLHGVSDGLRALVERAGKTG